MQPPVQSDDEQVYATLAEKEEERKAREMHAMTTGITSAVPSSGAAGIHCRRGERVAASACRRRAAAEG